MSSIIKAAFAVCFLFTAHISNAGRYFDNIRLDLTVPDHCRTTKPIHFAHSDDITFFTLSINGGEKRGFDYEYPADRDQMAMLYKVFKENSHHAKWFKDALKRDHELQQHYDILMANYQHMGFDMGSEGEVLEVLALKWIQDSYNAEEVFVTGSVVYHKSGNARAIGELDLIIASTRDCSIYSVGEAKLGTRSLGKAKRQLGRFAHFLKTTIAPFLENAFDDFDLKVNY